MIEKFLLFFLLCIGVCASQLTGCINADDTQRFRDSANSALASSKDISEVFASVKLLKETTSNRIECDCGALDMTLTSTKSSVDFYLGVATGKLCGCKQDLNVQAAINNLSNGETIDGICGGILLTSLIGQDSSVDVQVAIGKLRSLMLEDGTFRSSLNEDSSVSNTKLALMAISSVNTQSLNEETKEIIKEIVEKSFERVPSGDGSALSDPSLVTSLSKLSEKKLRLVGARLLSVTESLLDMKDSDDVVQIADAVEALQVISSYRAAPLCVELEDRTFQLGEPSRRMLKVSVKTVLGEDVVSEKIELQSIKRSAKDSADLVAQQQMDGGEYMLPDEVFGTAGKYVATVAVTIPERNKPVTQVFAITVADSLSIEGVYFGVSDSKQVSRSELAAVSRQNQAQLFTVSAVSNEIVHVEFSVKSMRQAVKKPHQATFRLTSVESGHSVQYPAKISDSADEEASSWTYRSAVAVAGDVELFSYRSGPYVASIVVGDVSCSAAVEFVIGKVEVAFPAKPAAKLPLYAKSLLHDSDVTLKALPEIIHQMRPPSKRASNFMSTVFTAASWVPLLLLVGYLLSLKPNFKFMGISGLAFVVCIVLTLTLYVGYWFSVEGCSFYQTIRYMFFIFPATFVVGKYALSSVTTARHVAENKTN